MISQATLNGYRPISLSVKVAFTLTVRSGSIFLTRGLHRIKFNLSLASRPGLWLHSQRFLISPLEIPQNCLRPSSVGARLVERAQLEAYPAGQIEP